METKTSEKRFLTADEEQELLDLSRGETLEYDTTETWIDLFKEQVALHPDRPAVVATDGTYTYRELDEDSDAVARYLIAKGLQPDTFIAIRMDRSRLFMAAALGAHKASVAYVPIDLDYAYNTCYIKFCGTLSVSISFCRDLHKLYFISIKILFTVGAFNIMRYINSPFLYILYHII